MSGDLNLPYEEIPDGPVGVPMPADICGGLVVRAGTVPNPMGEGQLPVLLFDFYRHDGTQVAPIALVQTREEFLALASLITQAARSAVRKTGRDE